VRAGAVLALCCDWIALLGRWMAPFLPGKAQALWGMLGNAGAVADAGWPEAPQPGRWRSLAAGQQLGAVGPLFAKIDDAAVAAEVARLGSRP
jgi:methionyl-tRNA synthetase